LELKLRKSVNSFKRVDGLQQGGPKEILQKKESTANISRCRLCNSVADPKHSKNLYRRQSETILRNAEIIFVGELRQESGFVHQICALCDDVKEGSTMPYKSGSLSKNIRAKRCVGL
jgi:hypothetical protein